MIFILNYHPGANEIEQINQEIYRQISQITSYISDISESPIKIEANTSTLHSIIDI